MLNLTKELWRYLVIGLALLSQFLKARMSYRFDFFVSMLATFISTGVGFLFLFALFNRIEALDGWSFNEVLFIYGFSLVPAALFSMVSINLWSFGSKFIIEGNLDRVLTRPLHPLYQILCESLRVEALQDIVVGSAIVYYSADKLGIALGFSEILFFLIFSIFGAIILLAFFSTIAAVNFWVEDRVGIEAPFFNMLSLGRYPLTIYNTLLRVALCTVIPFAFAAFFPSMWFIRSEQYLGLILLIPVIAFVYIIIALWVWKRGLRNYGSSGS